LIKSDTSIDFNIPQLSTSIQFGDDPTSQSNLVFKDYEKNDYHLIENSKAIGKGSNSNIIELPQETFDLDGVSRKSPPSIGCFEY
jgi:hypothetical protein